MVEDLIKIIEEIGEIYMQGSFEQDEELPLNFFTYFNFENDPRAYRDNKPTYIDRYYLLNYYTKDIKNINMLDDAIPKLLENGWIIKEYPHNVDTDEGYIGKSSTIIYKDKQ